MLAVGSGFDLLRADDEVTERMAAPVRGAGHNDQARGREIRPRGGGADRILVPDLRAGDLVRAPVHLDGVPDVDCCASLLCQRVAGAVSTSRATVERDEPR